MYSYHLILLPLSPPGDIGLSSDWIVVIRPGDEKRGRFRAVFIQGRTMVVDNAMTAEELSLLAEELLLLEDSVVVVVGVVIVVDVEADELLLINESAVSSSASLASSMKQ